MKRIAIVIAGLASFAVPAAAHQQDADQPSSQRPGQSVPVTQGTVSASAADVASIEAIMAAVYDVISGPAGQRRDANRMYSLFTSDARLKPKGPSGLRSISVGDYLAASAPVLEGEGFFEREVARRVEQFGDIAHVFSTYEARRTETGPVFMRGINSIQLVRHDGRWWVASLMWQQESPQNPIPEPYLSTPISGERG